MKNETTDILNKSNKDNFLEFQIISVTSLDNIIDVTYEDFLQGIKDRYEN